MHIVRSNIFGRVDAVFTIGLLLVASLYYGYLNYPNSTSGLLSDSTHYLLMADYFFEDAPSKLTTRIAEGSVFPPAYPVLIGVFGGGANNISLAHWVTTGVLIFCIGLFNIWLRQSRLPKASVWLLTLLFFTLPGIFLHSLYIASEFLFIATLLLIFILLEGNDRKSQGVYIAVGFLIGLAILSRSAGVVLLPAYIIYIYFRRVPAKLVIILSSFLLPLAWVLYKSRLGFGISYSSQFLENWSGGELGAVLSEFAKHFALLTSSAVGIFSLSPSALSYLILTLISLPFLFGFGHRLRQAQLDAVFLLGYVALIIVWPFPHEAKRFMLVVIPFFLFYSTVGASLYFRKFKRLSTVLPVGVCLIMFAVSLPSFYKLTNNMVSHPEPDIVAYTRNSYWFEAPNMIEANRISSVLRQVFEANKAIETYVPEGECVYATFADLVSLYGRRLGVETPIIRDKSQDKGVSFQACNYFFMVSIAGKQRFFPPMYPELEIKDEVEPIFVSYTLNTNHKFPYVAVLAKKKYINPVSSNKPEI